MSRRRNRNRQIGFSGAFGAVTGFVTGWLAVLAAGAAGLLLLMVFFRLWAETGSAAVAAAGTLLLPLGVVALWHWRGDMVALLSAWAGPRLEHRGVLLEPEQPVEFEGSTYTVFDELGRRRYDGSSGGIEQLTARLRAHCDPLGGTALSGLVGPGWELRVRLHGTRDQAYAVETAHIERHFGRPGYENRVRGRSVA